MRRSILIVALVLAALPATAGARSFTYLTTYAGTYDFTEKFRHEEGKPDGIDTTQSYRWAQFDYETITLHRDRTYTDKQTRYIAAKGTYKQDSLQGSTSQAGPMKKHTECNIASALTPFVRSGGGSYVQPIPVRQDPAINVGWTLPNYGSRPTNDAPPFTVTGTSDCDVFHSDFLIWTPSHPAGGLVGLARLTPTQRINDAFGDGTTIHYSDLRDGPWERNLKTGEADGKGTRPQFDGQSTEEAQVKVGGTVKFWRILNPKPENYNNKIGNLLLAEGFAGIGGQGTPGGPPAGGSGDDETVIVPGMGSGDVSFDVHGVVGTGGTPRVSAAGGQPLLATAKAKSRRAGGIVKLKIVPTAAGRQLLSAPHPEIKASYVLSFRPRGVKRTFSRTRAVTIPPRS